MKLFFYLSIFLLVFPITNIASNSPTGSVRAWAEIMAQDLYSHMDKNHERVYWSVNDEGNLVKKVITLGDCRQIVWDAWDASELNPSWAKWDSHGKIIGYGGRRTISINHIVAAYGQSRFNPFAIHINKTWGTIDFGTEQEDSCHWYDDGGRRWVEFCKHDHLNHNHIALLFNQRINMRFAAWLSEYLIRHHQKTYDLWGQRTQRSLYEKLSFDTVHEVPVVRLDL